MSNPLATRVPNAGGVLCDWQIRQRIAITPWQEGIKRPGVISYGVSTAGYDFRLGYRLLVPKTPPNSREAICPKMGQAELRDCFLEYDLRQYGLSWVIEPNNFVLAEVMESVVMPQDVIGIATGKSTYARLGLVANVTPLEPGWQGILTIELSNTSQRPIRIYAEEGILQVTFHQLTGVPEQSYAQKQGKYQNQTGVTLPCVDKP